MKNKIICLVIILVMLFSSILVISACENKDNKTEVTYQSISVEGPTEVTNGEFDYAKYKVCLTKSDGTKEETALTKEMLSEEDQAKLNVVGDHKIQVSYKEKSCFFNIKIQAKKEIVDVVNKSITIEGPTQVIVGEFDFSKYTITLTKLDNSTESIMLVETMISAEDKAKLQVVGNQEVTVNYSGLSCKLAVEILAIPTHTVTFIQEGKEDIVVEVEHNKKLLEKDIPIIDQNKPGYYLVWDKVDFSCIVEDIVVNIVKKGDGMVYTLSQDDTYYIATKYYGDAVKFVIPSEYDGGYSIKNENVNQMIAEEIKETLPVKEVAPSCFENCTNLQSVIIPDSIEVIGKDAFKNCINLELISIPSSVVKIGSGAIDGGENLTIITGIGSKPDGWDSNWIQVSDDYVLWGNSNRGVTDEGLIWRLDNNIITIEGTAAIEEYSEVNIPNQINGYDVKTIKSLGRKKYGVVNVAEGINTINEINAEIIFAPSTLTRYGGEGLIAFKEKVLPQGLKTYAPYVLNCTGEYGIDGYFKWISTKDNSIVIYGGNNIPEKITELYIPEKINNKDVIALEQGEYFVFNNHYDIRKLYMPDTLKVYDPGWGDVRELSYVKFSKNLEYIGDYAFHYTGIEEFIAPITLKYIGASAFRECRKLKTVLLQENVEYVGYGAFSCCAAATIALTQKEIPTNWAGDWNESGCKIILDCNAKSGSLDGLNWELNNNGGIDIVSYNGTAIDLSIPSVINNRRVESIKESTFENNATLKSIVVPEYVDYIGKNAFNNCSALEVINVGAKSQPAGWDANFNPQNIKIIWDCFTLHGITPDKFVWRLLPSGGIEIYDYIGFAKELIFPNEIQGRPVTKIGDLYYSEKIERVYIPQNIEDIIDLGLNSECAVKFEFAQNSHLKYLGRIGAKFSNELIIPASVIEIRENAFYWAEIPSLKFEENSKLEIIGNFAFADATIGGTILLPNTVRQLGYGVFRETQNTGTFRVPDGITDIDLSESTFSKIIVGENSKLQNIEAFTMPNLKTIYLPKKLVINSNISSEAAVLCPAFTQDEITQLSDYKRNIVFNCDVNTETEQFGDFTYVVDNLDNAIIIGYDGPNNEEITFPNTINNKPVIQVTYSALKELSGVKLYLGENTTQIEYNHAFVLTPILKTSRPYRGTNITYNYAGKTGKTQDGLCWAKLKDNTVAIYALEDKGLTSINFPAEIEGMKVSTISGDLIHIKKSSKIEDININATYVYNVNNANTYIIQSQKVINLYVADDKNVFPEEKWGVGPYIKLYYGAKDRFRQTGNIIWKVSENGKEAIISKIINIDYNSGFVIPSELEGLPVTTIDKNICQVENNINNNYAIALVVPKSVTKILDDTLDRTFSTIYVENPNAEIPSYSFRSRLYKGYVGEYGVLGNAKWITNPDNQIEVVGIINDGKYINIPAKISNKPVVKVDEIYTEQIVFISSSIKSVNRIIAKAIFYSGAKIESGGTQSNIIVENYGTELQSNKDYFVDAEGNLFMIKPDKTLALVHRYSNTSNPQVPTKVKDEKGNEIIVTEILDYAFKEYKLDNIVILGDISSVGYISQYERKDKILTVYLGDNVKNAKIDDCRYVAQASTPQPGYFIDREQYVIYNCTGEIGKTQEGFIWTKDNNGGVVIIGYENKNQGLITIPKSIDGEEVVRVDVINPYEETDNYGEYYVDLYTSLSFEKVNWHIVSGRVNVQYYMKNRVDRETFFESDKNRIRLNDNFAGKIGYSDDNKFKWMLNNDGKLTLIKFYPDRENHRHSTYEVVVPSTISGIEISEIGSYCFSNSNVDVLYLPSTIERVSCLAPFNYCEVRIDKERMFNNNWDLVIDTVKWRESNKEYITDDGLYQYEIKEDGTVKIVRYLEHFPKILNVPKYINGHLVNEIGQFAYMFDESSSPNEPMYVADKMILPDSIEILDNYALAGAFALEIELNEGLKYIGSHCFEYSAITKIVIPKTVEYMSSYIVSECPLLTNVFIPKEAVYISSRAISFGEEGAGNFEVFTDASKDSNGWQRNWSMYEVHYNNKEVTYSFDTNGGTNIDDIVSSLRIELPVPEKIGYKFVGWYDNKRFDGERFIGFYSSTKDIKLYAKWVKEKDFGKMCNGEIPYFGYILKENTTSICNSENHYVQFTAKQNAVYSIKVYVSNASITICSSSGMYLPGELNRIEAGTYTEFLLPAEMGKQYYMEIYYGSSEAVDVEVEISVYEGEI